MVSAPISLKYSDLTLKRNGLILLGPTPQDRIKFHTNKGSREFTFISVLGGTIFETGQTDLKSYF